ncbi:MAG: DUF4358 domain-containing protein [Cellulosilyticaceae bacterium]
MKKLSVILLALTLSMGALVGCSTGDASGTNGTNQEQTVKTPANEIVDQIVELGAVRMPMEIDETVAKDVYHIDTEIVENYGIAETGISPGPGLAIIAQAKDGQLDAVKANMEQLLQDKIGNAFYPDEKDAAEKAEIMVEGNYVALFILNDEVSADAIKLFEDAVK